MELPHLTLTHHHHEHHQQQFGLHNSGAKWTVQPFPCYWPLKSLKRINNTRELKKNRI